MSVNKAFVVKNSLEVNQKLILADSVRGKVGIGTSLPGYLLDVAGGIGVTDIYVSGTVYTVGITTIVGKLNVGTNGSTLTGVGGSVGVGTSSPQYLLDIRSPVSTGQTALYVQGDSRVTGNLDIGGNATLSALTLSNITVNNQATTQNLNVTGFNTSGYLNVTGIATIATLGVTGLTTTQNLNVTGFNTSGYLNVTGIATIATLGVTGTSTARNLQVIGFSTLGTIKISSGVVTATSGVVTYYGDGSKLTGVAASTGGTIGVRSEGVYVGGGVTTLDFKTTTGINVAVSAPVSGIATVTVQPGVSLGLAIALGG